jgi:hypothetical protein
MKFSDYNVSATAYQAWNTCYTPSGVAGNPPKVVGEIDTFANSFCIGLELESLAKRQDFM